MMGFFSKIFASANATGHTTVDDAEAAQQAQIKKIEALLDSVSSASQHVRNYYITFLLACFYIAMIVWSTTDLMLLKNTPVTMPLLNVDLPITGFYTFAPYFFLLLHFNLLLQFSLLADKVHRFDQAVIELQDEDSRRYYYTRLFAFVFTQILSARHHSGLLRFLLTLMVWITAIWLPLGILIGLQVGFLPFHDEDILFWQRVAVTLDLLVLLIFWPMIREADGRWRSWIKQASGLSWLLKLKATMQPVPVPPQESINRNSGYPVLEGSVSFLTGFFVIVFVWGIAVLPDSVHEKNVRDWLKAYAWSDGWQSLCPSKETQESYFIATEWLFDGRYDETALAFIDITSCDQRTKASVLHRNLILREQLLIANELKAEDEADLKSSNETARQAALKKVTGLVLSSRDLRYADFSAARLPKADFVGAHNMASDLRYVNFESAVLMEARMNKVLLQGVSLNDAKFQGAELGLAEFQGASLTDAEFQGANLNDAKFHGASLYSAKFQGANLKNSDFGLSVISMTRFGFLTQEAMTEIATELSEAILNKALSHSAIDQLMANFQSQKHIFAAAGNNIWDPTLMRTGLFGFWNGLKAASDWADYQNKLAGYWIELSCQDHWIGRRIIEDRIHLIALATINIAQCFLSLKDRKNQADQLICPAISEIDQKTIQLLQKLAAQKNPDATVTSTFACRTERSDPVAAAD